jgi:P-type Cu+ transporter
MCPEVSSDVAGDCPVCGMALELNPAFAGDCCGGDGDAETAAMRFRLWVSAALTAPVFILGMSHLAPGIPHDAWVNGHGARWIQGALSTPVVFWCGAPFFVRGWRSIRTRRLNMWTLVCLGVAAAWLFSTVALIAPGLLPASEMHGPPIYFESAAVIITLVIAGQVMEGAARERTGEALRTLMRLAPPSARRVTARGDVEIPLSEVAVGDLLRVRPGDHAPVDGVVVEGRSSVDESLLTGESTPVEKGPGAPILGGAVNGSGGFVMRASKIGADTFLARVVAMVAEAQRSRAPIQGLADRAAAVFVPVVVSIAALAFAAWLVAGPDPKLPHAVVAAVSVLIIACPCALGLATPMSVTVGVGRGAREGVLFRNAEALERLASVDTLVVDKTGTLTEGRLALMAFVPAEGAQENEVFRLVAAAEKGSEHPLAAAFVRAARERGVTPPAAESFEATTGGGISAVVEGRRVLVGTPTFLKVNGIGPLGTLEPRITFLQARGSTVVLAAVDGRPAGLFAAGDLIKDSAMPALEELRQLGVRIVMATGDQAQTAAFVAGELKISEVHAGIDPAGKAALIRNLKAEGRVVAMAGDGVNDAPALALADVGIAMGTGSDAAMASAGVTLVRGDLAAAVRAVRLSRRVSRNIRQNLAFAFAYNITGIPVAAGVLHPFFGITLNPMIAGVAMSLSCVSLIQNALRLRGRGGPEVA